MESAVQHGTAAFVAGLQAAGTGSHLAAATGAWRYGKRCAFPTSPHPRRRLRTNVQRGVTLTFHLVQKTGQVIHLWSHFECPSRVICMISTFCPTSVNVPVF